LEVEDFMAAVVDSTAEWEWAADSEAEKRIEAALAVDELSAAECIAAEDLAARGASRATHIGAADSADPGLSDHAVRQDLGAASVQVVATVLAVDTALELESRIGIGTRSARVDSPAPIEVSTTLRSRMGTGIHLEELAAA
jgi:hypothetical protein